MSLKKDIKRKLSHKGLLITLVSIVISAIFYVALTSENKQTKVVAIVNGDPIVTSELQHWMLFNKAEVYNYFYRVYEVSYDINFWTTEFNREIPLKKLKRQSLKEAVRFKVEQQLASELGVQVTMDYEQLMKERVRVNKNRKRKVQKGEVIYGPITFTSRDYMSKVHDEMVRSIKNLLSKTDFKLPDHKIRARSHDYKTNQATHSAGGDVDSSTHSFEAYKAVWELKHVNKKYEQLIEQLVLSARVKIIEDIFEEVLIE